MLNEVLELIYAKVDNDLLDQTIQWSIDKGNYDCHITCWLIQAKQYRSLELEYL